MKGISPDVEVLRVIRATPALDRIQAAGAALTPLVGRREESAFLEDAWESVGASTRGTCAVRTVFVRGEAGIGKSRLALALVGRVRDGGHVVFTAQCAQDGIGSPLFPIVRMVHSHLELDLLDDDAARVDGSRPRVVAAGSPTRRRCSPSCWGCPRTRGTNEPR